MSQFFEIVARIPLTGDALDDGKLIAGMADAVAEIEAAVGSKGTVTTRVGKTIDRPAKATSVARVLDAAE